MKRVSFEVAKAIKNAGYPQGKTNNSYIIETWNAYYPIGVVVSLNDFPANNWERHYHFADIPTYLEVWLWLWRKKEIKIKTVDNFATYVTGFEDEIELESYNDPEEAIEQAIEYLCDNNLIK